MTQVDPQEIRHLYRAVSRALRRWEEDPTEVTALRTTTEQVQKQLQEWEAAGAYLSTELRLVQDQVAHVNARLVLAHQAATRGYEKEAQEDVRTC